MRIGLDRIDGYATPEMLEAYAAAGGQLARTETIDMRALEARRTIGPVLVLDVRGQSEFDSGHVPDAINIAHTRLRVRLGELPSDQLLLVHCLTGARAAAAVSLLERHLYRAVAVDDTFANYARVDQPGAGDRVAPRN